MQVWVRQVQVMAETIYQSVEPEVLVHHHSLAPTCQLYWLCGGQDMQLKMSCWLKSMIPALLLAFVLSINTIFQRLMKAINYWLRLTKIKIVVLFIKIITNVHNPSKPTNSKTPLPHSGLLADAHVLYYRYQTEVSAISLWMYIRGNDLNFVEIFYPAV